MQLQCLTHLLESTIILLSHGNNITGGTSSELKTPLICLELQINLLVQWFILGTESNGFTHARMDAKGWTSDLTAAGTDSCTRGLGCLWGLPDGGGATAAPAACCLESPWKSDMRFHGLSKSPITPEKVASRFFKKKKKNRWRGLITRYILATKSLSWQHCPAELEVPCICYRRVSIAGAATEEIRSQWK